MINYYVLISCVDSPNGIIAIFSRILVFTLTVDPDPFTHVKKSEGGDEIDLSFLKELEESDNSSGSKK